MAKDSKRWQKMAKDGKKWQKIAKDDKRWRYKVKLTKMINKINFEIQNCI